MNTKDLRLRGAALELLGAAKYTLENPETDSYDSQTWAREIVAKLGPALDRGGDHE
jgi:hypothetical protein